jgi:predicted Ser/Thr protein kinase
MNLEELVENHLTGNEPDVPPELRAEFDAAIAAHDAIQYALAETILVPDSTVDDRPPPHLPDDYEIIRELGRGGMGVVYLASQQSLSRPIAVKVLRPGEVTYGPLVQRFMEEARHLARLRHPNIVSVHEIGEAEGEPYFTMDYVEGESLANVLSREHLSPSRALAILNQVAEGVQHAHSHGIIHRDLKPGNILLDAQNHAYVTDFGLARDMTQSAKLTRSGEIMGTPVYMAPEQARGETDLIGEATDIHALGAVMYEMLTGQTPYGCDSPANVLVRLLKDDPEPLRRLDRRIPRDLETICLKALAKSPTQRYASVRAFQEDIRRFESGEPVLARRPGAIYHGVRFVRRHWKIATAIAATAALALVIATAFGPQVFDKTREELVAWAEESHVQGRHDEAVRVYRRALAKTEGVERREILNKMIRCCGEIGDVKGLVAAALTIVEDDPDASFGKHDFLVAQAVYANVVESRPNLLASVSTRSEADVAQLAFAAKRYEVFLQGPHGSTAERERAAEQLREIHGFLDTPREVMLGSRSSSQKLPEGTSAELLKVANDTRGARWQRGQAAYAAGLSLEQSGDTRAALVAFRQAFDLMRSVFPTYAGISMGTRSSQDRGVEHIESAECGLLRDAFEAVRRLDPETPDALTGGIRFRIEGVQLPPGLVPKVRLELFDQSVTIKSSDRLLPRLVPIQQQTGFAGVADGRYRVSIRYGGSYSSDDSGRIGSLLELDFGGLPKTVEISGNTLELVIPARLSEEITLVEPANNATIDLRTEFFRWSKIDDAAYYKVVIVKKENRVGEGRYYTSVGSPVQVRTNSMCLGTVPDSDRNQADGLTPGTSAAWQVHAFDADGRRIGASVQADRTFLVGKGLRNE